MNVARTCLAVAFAWTMTASVLGQEPKSSPLARALATALDAAKLDAIAAPDPTQPDVFVAALYIPGIQLLTVSAKYPAPGALRGKLATKAYRDIYLDLNGGPASVSRVFVEDCGADGLHGRQGETQPFDLYEATDAHLVFDSNRASRSSRNRSTAGCRLPPTISTATCSRRS